MTAIHFVGAYWWLWIVGAAVAFTVGCIQEKLRTTPYQDDVVSWIALKVSLIAVLALYGGIGMFLLALLIRSVRFFL